MSSFQILHAGLHILQPQDPRQRIKFSSKPIIISMIKSAIISRDFNFEQKDHFGRGGKVLSKLVC